MEAGPGGFVNAVVQQLEGVVAPPIVSHQNYYGFAGRISAREGGGRRIGSGRA